MSIRRICFYGGPGSGKSTLASKTFTELKTKHYDVELVSEYIKAWAHEGRRPTSYDQLYVFAKQLKAEDVILRNVGLIVTDSPLLMNTAYAKMYNVPFTPHLVKLAQEFDREFKPINFFIDRTVPYVGKGRYQTNDEAIFFDNLLQDVLKENLEGELHHVVVEDFNGIIRTIEEAVVNG